MVEVAVVLFCAWRNGREEMEWLIIVGTIPWYRVLHCTRRKHCRNARKLKNRTEYYNWISLYSHVPDMMVFLCVVSLFLCDAVLNIRLNPEFVDMFSNSVSGTPLSFRESWKCSSSSKLLKTFDTQLIPVRFFQNTGFSVSWDLFSLLSILLLHAQYGMLSCFWKRRCIEKMQCRWMRRSTVYQYRIRMRDLCFSERIVENAQHSSWRGAKLTKFWHTGEGRVLEKTSKTSDLKKDELTLDTVMLVWRENRTEG